MSNEKELKYFRDRTGLLEAEVAVLKNRNTELQRVIVNYRGRSFPSGTEEATKNAIEDRWAKQSEGDRRREERQRICLRRSLK